MIKYFSFALFVFCLFLISSVDGARYLKKKPGCDEKALRKVDQTMARLVSTGPTGRKMPENSKQLKVYCNETIELVNYVDNFIKKCYTTEIKDFSKIMIYSVKNSLKQFCRKRSKKLSSIMSVAPCINNEVRNNQVCMKRFIDQVRDLQNIRNDKLKIPHTCCRFVESISCVESHLERIPCARQNLPIIMDFLRGIFGNLVNFACGDYNEATSKCDELGPQPKPTVKSTKQYSTFMFALIDLLESMGKPPSRF